MAELDFDNEMDALLRREGGGRTITISEFADGMHLDADEIAAFAERTVPERTRQTFVRHFADCDRCRQMLAAFVRLAVEEVPATAPVVVAPAEQAMPWYRRLFAFPNLAYAMGGLIVLFAGFIGLSVYTGMNRNAAEISSAGRSEKAPAAPVQAEPDFTLNSNAAATTQSDSSAPSNSANAAANTFVRNDQTAANAATGAPADKPLATPVAESDDFAEKQRPFAAAPPPKDIPVSSTEQNKAEKPMLQENRPAAVSADRKRDMEEAKIAPKATPPPPQAETMTRMKSARRETSGVTLDGTDSLAMKKSEAKSAPGGRAAEPYNRRQVSGRSFEFRQGAWYDTTYRGQGTINVRRNTNEYKRLDSGLRGIAEKFFGTVVTTWNGKAYRIQ